MTHGNSNNEGGAGCLLDPADVDPSDAPDGLPQDPALAYTGPTCSECGMPGENLEESWCQHCGYYAKYGTTVDVEVMEAASEPAEFPKWVKKAGIIAGAAFAASVAARFALSAFPTVHMIVGTAQLLLGLALFMALHAAGFLQFVLTDSGAKLMELLNPYGIWAPIFAELPKTEKRILSAWAGICIGFSSLITGGQPTSWLEFTKTMVATEEEPDGDGRQGPSGTGDLESAVKDFAKKGTRMVQTPGEGVGAGHSEGFPLAPAPEGEEEEQEEWLDAECVIIGYIPQPGPIAAGDSSKSPNGEDNENAAGPAAEPDAGESDPTRTPATVDPVTGETIRLPAIRTLIVASQVGRTLCVVGYVSEGVTAEVADDLLTRFDEHHRDSPFVRCDTAAIWLEPKFVCNIKYKQWDPRAGLLEPKFDSMLQVLP